MLNFRIREILSSISSIPKLTICQKNFSFRILSVGKMISFDQILHPSEKDFFFITQKIPKDYTHILQMWSNDIILNIADYFSLFFLIKLWGFFNVKLQIPVVDANSLIRRHSWCGALGTANFWRTWEGNNVSKRKQLPHIWDMLLQYLQNNPKSN